MEEIASFRSASLNRFVKVDVSVSQHPSCRCNTHEFDSLAFLALIHAGTQPKVISSDSFFVFRMHTLLLNVSAVTSDMPVSIVRGQPLHLSFSNVMWHTDKPMLVDGSQY